MNQIEQAKNRVTGKLKVTGGAKYAAEFAIAIDRIDNHISSSNL